MCKTKKHLVLERVKKNNLSMIALPVGHVFLFLHVFLFIVIWTVFQGSHMEIFSPFEGSDMAFPVHLRAHTCCTAFYSLIFVGRAAQFFPYLQPLCCRL